MDHNGTLWNLEWLLLFIFIFKLRGITFHYDEIKKQAGAELSQARPRLRVSVSSKMGLENEILKKSDPFHVKVIEKISHQKVRLEILKRCME